MSDVDSTQDQAPVAAPAPVQTELGQAFERLYHAVERRTAAEDARGAIEQEARDAEQEHRDAWDQVTQLTAGKIPVAP